MDEFCSDGTPFLLLLPIRQLRQIYVQHFGRVPQPADIKLYIPFHNRECLYCHAGMRAFEKEPKHSKTPAMISLINSNQMSYASAHCHDTIHVATIHLRRSGKEASSLPNTPQTSLGEHRLRWAGFLIAVGE